MSIQKIPGVYYTENVETEATSTIGKIPVFIGKTGNTGTAYHKVDGSQLLTFSSYDEAKRPMKTTETGEDGIGTYNSSGELQPNPLLDVIKDFFTEVKPLNNSDISVNKIYVVDLGEATSDVVWSTGLNTCKSAHDIEIEVYVGADSVTGHEIKDIIHTAAEAINSHVNLDLRCGFYTKNGATDSELKTLNMACQEPRIGLIEPYSFGKFIGLICCTPYHTEPGYLTFRTISAGEFSNRTPALELELQNAGVIFGHDELTTTMVYPKINLCTTSEFGKTPRPADSLFHARFNADNLLKQIFDVCYTQIKKNETATNIAYLQTQIDKIIDEEVLNGYMVEYNSTTGKGTKLTVYESDENPYDLVVTGQIHCINLTSAINVEATIINP